MFLCGTGACGFISLVAGLIGDFDLLVLARDTWLISVRVGGVIRSVLQLLSVDY